MNPQAWSAVAIVAVVFVGLALGRHPPYLVLMAGLSLMVISGLVEPAEAFAGFGNPGLVTVGVLFVVAAALRQTGALTYVVQRALGRPRSARHAQLRLVPPVLTASAFLNNTPVVAMLVPVVADWCKANHVPASKLLLPLSYTAILGGLCTLIGTSTSLVVNGMLIATGRPGLGLFEIAWVGLPCALVGLLFMLLSADRLLKPRNSALEMPADLRQYTVEMIVSPTSPLVGKSVESAGLRRLPGLFLMEIHRGHQLLPVVNPGEQLEPNDQLVFVGVVDSVIDLQRFPGLQPATSQLFKLDSHRAERCFAEAVVSRTCPLIGGTIREGRFRNRYSAVVIAVSRHGERIPGRIGDIELRPGDSLLLEAQASFVEQQRNARDFYLVSRLDGDGPPTTAQAPVSLVILLAMVILATTGVLSMLQAALLAAGAFLLTRCCSEEIARKSIDWPLLLAIGASFGLGRALESTGAAAALADGLLARAGSSPWLALAVIYGVTTLLSELVTNNAAAVIVFPIALSTATQLGVHHMPFVVAVMIAASASFATPLGYQTNLMVYGPGGYRLADFLKMGVPMNLLMWIVTCSLAPLVWPF